MKLEFGAPELEFSGINVKHKLFQTLKNCPKLILMLLNIWGSNENFAYVSKSKIHENHLLHDGHNAETIAGRFVSRESWSRTRITRMKLSQRLQGYHLKQ